MTHILETVTFKDFEIKVIKSDLAHRAENLIATKIHVDGIITSDNAHFYKNALCVTASSTDSSLQNKLDEVNQSFLHNIDPQDQKTQRNKEQLVEEMKRAIQKLY